MEDGADEFPEQGSIDTLQQEDHLQEIIAQMVTKYPFITGHMLKGDAKSRVPKRQGGSTERRNGALGASALF